MNCRFHVHAQMQEQAESLRQYNQQSNVEETYRMVLRCQVWADHAQTRRCSHCAVIYLPTRSKLCHDCGCILSCEQRQAGRKRCCKCERVFRNRVR